MGVTYALAFLIIGIAMLGGNLSGRPAVIGYAIFGLAYTGLLYNFLRTRGLRWYVCLVLALAAMATFGFCAYKVEMFLHP